MLRSGDPGPPNVAVLETDVHGIFFTSGTTGPSKGVLSPHSQPIAIAAQTAACFGYRAGDVLYTCLPLFHVNALWYTSYAALWAGATVALGTRFSASRYWDEVRDNGATAISSLGSMTNILLKAPESGRDREHSVRTAFIVPTGREVVERFEARFGVRVVSGFGATETFMVSALGPDRDPGAPLESAGRITEFAQVRIAAEDGRPVPAGTAGEILVRPTDVGTVMHGYHAMGEATQTVFRDLWFHSGSVHSRRPVVGVRPPTDHRFVAVVGGRDGTTRAADRDEDSVAAGLCRYLDAGATEITLSHTDLAGETDRIRTWRLAGKLANS